MPIFKDIAYHLGDKWREIGGDYKQNGKNIFLYWGSKDGENHIHVYNDEKKPGVWNYNIKCKNNAGKDRIEHTISESQSMEDLLSELQTNWKKECPSFISEMEIEEKYLFKTKYLKYKKKYLELKKLIGGAVTPDDIQREWTNKGHTVSTSEGQDGWFLSWGTRKDSRTHIHLYSDGSYTYKINDKHTPSNEYADTCHFYSIYNGHRRDEHGCRYFEPTRRPYPSSATEWCNFMLNSFDKLWRER